MGTIAGKTIGVLCNLLLLGAWGANAQTIRYVTTTGTNTNPATATSWATSTTNLQGAITASGSGDQVWVAQGTYFTTKTLDPTISFAMKDGVAIYGGFVGTETSLASRTLSAANASILSGDIGVPGDVDDNSYHVFLNVITLSAASILDGFVITGGNANQGTVDYGGGMLNNGIAQPTIRNCTFRGNAAPGLVSGSGGAVYAIGNLRLINCNFDGNSAQFGGALFVTTASATTVINCSFQANSARDGGAAFCFGATMTMLNCSFQRNTATNTGGAVAGQNSNTMSGTVSLVNSILWSNGSNTLTRISGTLSIRNSLSEATSFTATGITTGPGNRTAVSSPFTSSIRTTLVPCSQAKDGGDVVAYTAASGPSIDLAGNPRIRNGQIDMGAYESLPVTRLYVRENAVGRATGLSWTDALTTLPAALSYACQSDLTEIWVAAGTYRPTTTTGPASRTISFQLRNGLSIIGSFAGTETTLSERQFVYANGIVSPTSTLSGDIGVLNNSTDNAYHVLRNNSGLTNTAVLDGFRITGGYADASSGVDQNGAGMYNANGASPSLRNTLFESNTAVGQGGGLYNLAQSSPVLTNCAFRTNAAIAEGGAICNQTNSNPTMTNCAFISNTSIYGGALLNFNSTSTCLNCAFLNNTGTNGWAIYSNGGGNVLTNTIVWGNGGGSTFGHTAGATTSAQYSLFAPGSIAIPGFVSGPGNLTTTSSPFINTTTPVLTACAIAINAGSPTTTTATVGTFDLAGSPRFFNGGRIDMGALEYQGASALVESVQDGNWTNTATWSCARVPLLTDTVWLKHIVTLPANTTGNALLIRYNPAGRLAVGSGSRVIVGF